jgi:hypothetical protein
MDEHEQRAAARSQRATAPAVLVLAGDHVVRAQHLDRAGRDR